MITFLFISDLISFSYNDTKNAAFAMFRDPQINIAKAASCIYTLHSMSDYTLYVPSFLYWEVLEPVVTAGFVPVHRSL
jgi:hypothetical protein